MTPAELEKTLENLPTKTGRDEDMERLRNSKASWETTINHPAPLTVDRSNIRKWEPVRFDIIEEEPAIPAPIAAETTSQVTSSANEEYSFQLDLDQVNDDDTVDIHVGYGEINNTAPDGMDADDDYIFTITDDGTEIYAVIAYDTTTLEITSRTLAFGASVPDNTFGTLYVPIGFVDIDRSSGSIGDVFPHNRQCGDINITFVFGAVNGQPALFYPPYGDPVLVT